jgi:hypothetical protein
MKGTVSSLCARTLGIAIEETCLSCGTITPSVVVVAIGANTKVPTKAVVGIVGRAKLRIFGSPNSIGFVPRTSCSAPNTARSNESTPSPT